MPWAVVSPCFICRDNMAEPPAKMLCDSLAGDRVRRNPRLCTDEGANILARMLARMPICPDVGINIIDRDHDRRPISHRFCGPVAWLLILGMLNMDLETPVPVVLRSFRLFLDKKGPKEIRGPIRDVFYWSSQRECVSLCTVLNDVILACKFLQLGYLCYRPTTREFTFTATTCRQACDPCDAKIEDFAEKGGLDATSTVVRVNTLSNERLLLGGAAAAKFLCFVTDTTSSLEDALHAADLLALKGETLGEVNGKSVAGVAIMLGALPEPTVVYSFEIK